MKTGRHLIAELYRCRPDSLKETQTIRAHMLAAAEMVGGGVIGDTFHNWSPQGVSGAVVLGESHLSIHTWPETGYVAVDIFTCAGLDPRPGLDYLERALQAEWSRVREIVRGLETEVADPPRTPPEESSSDEGAIIARTVSEEYVG